MFKAIREPQNCLPQIYRIYALCPRTIKMGWHLPSLKRAYEQLQACGLVYWFQGDQTKVPSRIPGVPYRRVRKLGVCPLGCRADCCEEYLSWCRHLRAGSSYQPAAPWHPKTRRAMFFCLPRHVDCFLYSFEMATTNNKGAIGCFVCQWPLGVWVGAIFCHTMGNHLK